MKYTIARFGIGVVILLLIVGGVLVGATNSTGEEIESIKASDSIAEQQEHYRALIERVGLERAQQMLYESGLPFNGQTHLLNHAAGEYTYETYGSAGIAHCKDYFLQSCYHGVVIATIAHDGIGEFSGVLATCRERGGERIAIQCAHGIGHGLLAFSGYKNLPQALEACDTLREQMEDFPLMNCHDGVFMENLWGIHESGAPSPDRWIDPERPLYPCSSPEIHERWQKGCWSNQASVMFQFFEGDIAKVTRYCDSVDNPSHRNTCMDGLARQIHPIAGGNADAVAEMCSETGATWRSFCVAVVAGSEYAVGGRDLPFKLCERETEPSKSQCYDRLIGTVLAYNGASACELIPSPEYRKKCETTPAR